MRKFEQSWVGKAVVRSISTKVNDLAKKVFWHEIYAILAFAIMVGAIRILHWLIGSLRECSPVQFWILRFVEFVAFLLCTLMFLFTELYLTLEYIKPIWERLCAVMVEGRSEIRKGKVGRAAASGRPSLFALDATEKKKC